MRHRGRKSQRRDEKRGEEKRREENRREGERERERDRERKSQRKEDASALKDRKGTKHCVFAMIVAPEGRRVQSHLAR